VVCLRAIVVVRYPSTRSVVRGRAGKHPPDRHRQSGGRFVARETEGDERDRLFALAADLYLGYPKYAERTDRTIRMLRLAPAPE
jgi:hypothetical protein